MASMRRPTTRRCDSESMFRNLQRFRQLAIGEAKEAEEAKETKEAKEASLEKIATYLKQCLNAQIYII